MKIKRYFAADMRQAIRLVRDEQGPDAVILSNRKVDGGVEIVAAVDYDERLVHSMAAEAAAPPPAQRPPAAAPVSASAPRVVEPVEEAVETVAARPAPGARIVWSQDPAMVAMKDEIKTLRGMLESQLTGLAWREQTVRHPLQVKVLQRLLRLGLAPALCRQLAEQVQYAGDEEHHWRQALGYLARQVRVTDDDILSRGGVVALVGPTGVGKTTTVAKLAARYILRHGASQVALVTTDSFRIGAHQQLRTYGRLLGVTVHTAGDAQELREVLAALKGKQLVLIDTAGMSQRDVRLAQQFAMLHEGAPRVRSYLVLSAAAQRAALTDAVRAFRNKELAGCILTKVDEAAGLGEALSVVVQQRLPVAYISDGQRVPEDLHPARANKLVSRSVALMQDSEVPEEETLAEAFGRMVS